MHKIIVVLAILHAAPIISANASDVLNIEPEAFKLDRQMACLTRNIYYEARGEDTLGMVAVGLVTLQRVASPHYPNTICEVVHQPKMFSWTIMEDLPKTRRSIFYGRCLSAAKSSLLAHTIKLDIVLKGADHYHNVNVKPYWVDSMSAYITTIGNHKFYKR